MAGFNIRASAHWESFCQRYKLSEHIQDQYVRYIQMLVEENGKYNLTALTSVEDIIAYHLDDALRLSEYLDFSLIKAVADVGSGCGVPGLILACAFPSIHFNLLEVLNKRVAFLQKVCEELHITNCTVISQDFKSYVRKGKGEVDLFVARASLGVEELLYIYSGASAYQSAKLIYWGSDRQTRGELMEGSKYAGKVSCEEYIYKVGEKNRIYFSFSPLM